MEEKSKQAGARESQGSRNFRQVGVISLLPPPPVIKIHSLVTAPPESHVNDVGSVRQTKET